MDIPPEVASVASSTATTLSQTVATDSWNGLKNLLSKLLGNGNETHEKQQEAELERAENRIIQARENEDEVAIEKVVTAWAYKIEEYLDEHPHAVEQFQKMLEQYGPQVDAEAGGNVTQKFTARGHGTNYVAGKSQIVRNYKK